MGFRVKRTGQKINAMGVIGKIVARAIGLWIGSALLGAVATSMANTTQLFYQGLQLVGFEFQARSVGCVAAGGTQTLTDCSKGTISGTNLVVVIGLIVMASIVLDYVKISF